MEDASEARDNKQNKFGTGQYMSMFAQKEMWTGTAADTFPLKDVLLA